MKRLPGLLGALVLVAGCAGISVEPSRTTQAPETAMSTEPAPITTTLAHSATTAPSGPPVAWIAPSGVPLAVTGVDGETIEVLTPCGNPETLTQGTPIYDVDVVIDPGHGGPVDTGAVGATGIKEKDINLAVSHEVQRLLMERGISSMLTRVGDYPIPIPTRTEYSDLVGAEVVVSIHHNAPAAPSSTIPGVEIFVQSQTPESARLGGLLYDETMDALAEFEVDWDRAPDAGVMTVTNTEGSDAYGMVRLPSTTSALIELGYIANRAEAELYDDPAYVPAAASAVADAIETFLTTSDTGSPLVEGRVFDPQSGVGKDRCIEPDLFAGLYPEVVDVVVTGDANSYNFIVTVSSPYDTVDRYADAWRVIGDDGVVYGTRELIHDHASEQPFSRALEGVAIPDTVHSVIVQGRDLVYGWGGGTIQVTLP